MDRSSTSKAAKQVLVVGGGFAGLSAVQTLCDSNGVIRVTLVSSLNVFEFGPQMLRSLADPSLYEQAIRNLQSTDFSFIHGVVLELKKHEAKLMCFTTNKHSLVQFDFCIWACGSLYPEPITNLYLNSIAQRKKMLYNAKLEIERANRLLVVGGGLRGVEMAALLTEMSSKTEGEQSILITTSAKSLLSDLPPAAGIYAAEFLFSKGVEISFEKRVQKVDENQLHCRDNAKGEKVAVYKGAEFVFWAFARENRIVARPLLHGGLVFEEELNKTGRVFVRKTLQLSHHSNIFAIGDCSVVVNDKSGDRAKTFFSAIEAGRIAAKNILILAKDDRFINRPKTLFEYPKDAFPFGTYPELYCVSLGNNAALMIAGPFLLTGQFALRCKKSIEYLAVGVLGDPDAVRRRMYGFVLRCIYTFCVAAGYLYSWIS